MRLFYAVVHRVRACYSCSRLPGNAKVRVSYFHNSLKHSYMTDDELQSQVIDFLRFPLAVGVVLIHASADSIVMNGVSVMEDGQFPVFQAVSFLCSKVFAAIAVPLFFFISGYLFFYKLPGFAPRAYGQKLRKRVKSLLLPYLFWNLVMMLLYWAVQTVVPGMMSGRFRLVADYSLTDWLWSIWNRSMADAAASHGLPFNYPLWFVRDLMMMVLLSPLIYFCVKKLRGFAVALLGLLWMFDIGLGMPGFSTVAFFFFATGAWFSLSRRNFMQAMRPYFKASAVLYAALSLALLCFRDAAWNGYLIRLSIVVGIVLVVSLAARYVESGRWKPNAFLAGSSFFIYAYHGMPVTFALKGLFRIVQPQGELSMLAVYFATIGIIVLLGLGLYWVVKKCFPALSPLLTGSR